MRYRNNIYSTATDVDDGKTIGERLKIVKSGISVSSCIRLTSNWFASTIYRYMTLLEIDPKFNIADLRNIG